MWRQIMVIPHTFSPFRHSRVRWHAETNVVFCTFCHPEASDPMTCRDKLWSFCTLFRHSDTVASNGTQRLTSSSTPFVIQRRQARWHAGTIWSRTFSPFCHLEAVGPMTCGNHLVPQFFTFCHPEAASLMACGEPFDPAPFFTIQKQSSPIARGEKLWSSAPFVDWEEWIRQYQDDVSVLITFRIFVGSVGREIRTKLVSYLFLPFYLQ